jgi:hypothetical protein
VVSLSGPHQLRRTAEADPEQLSQLDDGEVVVAADLGGDAGPGAGHGFVAGPQPIDGLSSSVEPQTRILDAGDGHGERDARRRQTRHRALQRIDHRSLGVGFIHAGERTRRLAPPSADSCSTPCNTSWICRAPNKDASHVDL